MQQWQRTTLYVTCMTGFLVLSGCSDNDNNSEPANDEVTIDTPMMQLDEGSLEQFEGFWEQRGYGNLFDFDGSRTTSFALTENTCIEINTDPGLAGLSPEEISQTFYDLQGDQLIVAFPGEAFATRLHRVDALPERCADTVARDAQGTFDYLWQTFDEYYAFFELRNVDWLAQYESQLPRVAEATDDAALFSLLSDLLSPIDDGHVVLSDGSDFFSPAQRAGLGLAIEQAFEQQSEIADIDTWFDTVISQLRENIVMRLDENSVNDQGPLIWGTADNGSTGYLFIEQMVGFVLDESGNPVDNSSAAEELAAASATMDQAIADLSNTSHMIVDVRLNGGGLDSIALNFAQRFTSERQLALSKTARSRDIESAPVQAFLEPPATGAYLNPVSVLISTDTASAAEIFAISMNQLPQVTLIGENTEGILSDILVKPLPNGWIAGLSNEVYLDAQGSSFEGAGVSPDIESPVFRIEDIRNGADPALDIALTQ